MTDRLAMLRAAVLFNTRVGRAPQRRDLRLPDRAKWEAVLGLPLPSDRMIQRQFGTMEEFRRQAGLKAATRSDFADVEAAAIHHAHRIYPELELVVAEANHFDAYLLNGERVEIKGSHLQTRFPPGEPPLHFFHFKTHHRAYHQTVDRLLCVGVGSHPETNEVTYLALFDFPQHALSLVTNKPALTVYGTSIWGTGMSQYTPYLRDRAPLALTDLPHWVRPHKRALVQP